MKVKLLTICLTLLIGFQANAQVYDGDIVLNTQAEVDSFAINCNCTTIAGDLDISGTQITNLNGLSALEYIERSLTIFSNELLNNLDGLNNLTSIGQGLAIIENENLENLDSFDSLTSVGDYLSILGNSSLSQIDALENVGPVSDYIDISQNDMLLNVDGIINAAVSLNSYLTVSNNDMLTHIDSLYNLQYLEGTLRITGNENLENINGLGNLQTLDGTLYIRNNPSLISIDSLINLSYIGENLWIDQNPALEDLGGLSNVTEIRGYLRIRSNDLLSGLEPLANVDTVYSRVEIIDNANLSQCCGIKCWPYTVTQSSITVQNNNTDCNSMLEIWDVCTAEVCDGLSSSVDLKVFLEGPYLESLNAMHTDLNDLNLDIAVGQPYHEPPYNYKGGKFVSQVIATMVDWVLVEARIGEPQLSGTPGTTTIETKAGIVLANGSIVGSDGISPLQFFYLEENTDYYFCIRHRNHLDFLSADAISRSELGKLK